MPEADRNLDGLTKKDQRFVLDAIEEQLSFEPNVPGRNRKRLRPNQLAEWELRLDRFRIFYDIDDTKKVVGIVAIGIKIRSQLWIGGREFNL